MEVLEKVNLTILYDIYGELLTDKQKLIFDKFVNNDEGLSEIAESLGISRQAVKDAINSVTSQLKTYEEKLNIKKQYEQNNILIDSVLEKETFSGNEAEVRKILQKLKKNL